jgi:hypothetical protein
MHRTAGGMLRVAGEVHGAVERWQVAPWSLQTARDTSARRGRATRGAPVRVGRARGPTARRVHGPSGRLRCGRGGRARKASGCYKGPGGVQRGRKAVPPWCAERAFYPEAALRLDVTHLHPLACHPPTPPRLSPTYPPSPVTHLPPLACYPPTPPRLRVATLELNQGDPLIGRHTTGELRQEELVQQHSLHRLRAHEQPRGTAAAADAADATAGRG